MYKTQNSVRSLQGTDSPLFTHRTPFIWLEFLRPVMFYPSSDPSFQPGALHAIDWKPSLERLRHIFNLVCFTTDLKEEDFVVMPAFRYTDPQRHVAKPGAGLFANEGVEISDSLNNTIAGVLTMFCMTVLTSQDNADQQQLFSSDLPPETREKTLIFAENFLASRGGKKVGDALLVRTTCNENLWTGTYRPAKDSPLPIPTKWNVSGEIDGVRGKLRTVYINVGEKKIIPILFDEEKFREQLRCRVLDELIYDFEVETEWIAIDKSIDRLVSFAPGLDGAAPNQLF
jgi:hypothetical protein